MKIQVEFFWLVIWRSETIPYHDIIRCHNPEELELVYASVYLFNILQCIIHD